MKKSVRLLFVFTCFVLGYAHANKPIHPTTNPLFYNGSPHWYNWLFKPTGTLGAGWTKEGQVVRSTTFPTQKFYFLPGYEKALAADSLAQWQDEGGVDCIRYTLTPASDSVLVGVETEFVITAEYIPNIPYTWQNRGCGDFSIKVFMPEGFVHTGGSYVDFEGFSLRPDGENKITRTIKGYFTEETPKACFLLTKGVKFYDPRYLLIVKDEKCVVGYNKTPETNKNQLVVREESSVDKELEKGLTNSIEINSILPYFSPINSSEHRITPPIKNESFSTTQTEETCTKNCYYDPNWYCNCAATNLASSCPVVYEDFNNSEISYCNAPDGWCRYLSIDTWSENGKSKTDISTVTLQNFNVNSQAGHGIFAGFLYEKNVLVDGQHIEDWTEKIAKSFNVIPNTI